MLVSITIIFVKLSLNINVILDIAQFKKSDLILLNNLAKLVMM